MAKQTLWPTGGKRERRDSERRMEKSRAGRQRGQGGNQGNGERNEWREQRAEDTGQLGKL